MRGRRDVLVDKQKQVEIFMVSMLCVNSVYTTWMDRSSTVSRPGGSIAETNIQYGVVISRRNLERLQ